MEIRTYDLDELQNSKHRFKGTMMSLKEELLTSEGFARRDNKCNLILNGKVFETSLNLALVNLIFLQFFVDSEIKIIDEDIYDSNVATGQHIEDYANHCLNRFIESSNDYNKFKDNFQNVNDEINGCVDFSIKRGVNFSLYDFIKIIAEDGEGAKLFKPNINTDEVNFKNIENMQDKYADEVMKYVETRNDLDLYDFVSAKTGINKNQFRQLCCFVGLKPDMYDGIIPKVVDDNYLYGMSTEEHYYINCVGARKAMRINKENVRQAGYTTRILDTAMVDTVHNPDVEDCKTKHYIELDITDEVTIKRLNGRHYYEFDDEGKVGKELKTISIRNNYNDLIGKRIALRSPITCANKDGICATCYGQHLSEINRYIHVGIVAVKIIMEVIMQYLLSAKHFLQTNSININFDEIFNEVFNVNLDTVVFKPNTKFHIEINNHDMKYIEDFEEYLVRDITIVNNETGDHIECESTVDLYLNKDIVLKHDKNVTIIKPTDELSFIFKYLIENEAITRSLKELVNIFESTKHADITDKKTGFTDVHKLVQKFIDLTNSNKSLSSKNIIHGEVIISALIADPKTKKRPNFLKTKFPEYIIQTASQSSINGPITRSLSFEYVQAQFENINTFNKDSKSYIDHMFR